MPFLATCPGCGHEKRQALADYPGNCPRCATPWRDSVRTDPPVDPAAVPIRQTLHRLEHFIGAACLFTPEEAFTARRVFKESFAVVHPDERRLRACIANFLRARARGVSGEPPR